MKIKKLIVAVVALAMTALSAQASFIFRVTVEGTSYTNNENGVSSKNVTTKSILKDAAKEMEVPAKNLVLLWDTLSGVIYIADAKTGEPLAVLLTLLDGFFAASQPKNSVGHSLVAYGEYSEVTASSEGAHGSFFWKTSFLKKNAKRFGRAQLEVDGKILVLNVETGRPFGDNFVD